MEIKNCPLPLRLESAAALELGESSRGMACDMDGDDELGWIDDDAFVAHVEAMEARMFEEAGEDDRCEGGSDDEYEGSDFDYDFNF